MYTCNSHKPELTTDKFTYLIINIHTNQSRSCITGACGSTNLGRFPYANIRAERPNTKQVILHGQLCCQAGSTRIHVNERIERHSILGLLIMSHTGVGGFLGDGNILRYDCRKMNLLCICRSADIFFFLNCLEKEFSAKSRR